MIPYLYPSKGSETDSNAGLWSIQSWQSADSDVKNWTITVNLFQIKGTISIDGDPAIREIVVISALGPDVLGSVTSNSDGKYSIYWEAYGDSVISIMLDKLGIEWASNGIYIVGDIIYPAVWNGWQYECISPGIGSVIEPAWWVGEGVTGFIGTATFAARQYIAAQANGLNKPLIVEGA